MTTDAGQQKGFSATNLPENNYIDNLSLGTSKRLLCGQKLATNQPLPWFLAVGYRDPHLPWRFPGKFGGIYPGKVLYTNLSAVPIDKPKMA